MAGVYADTARSLAADFERDTGIRVLIVAAPYLTLREKELTDLLNGTSHYDVMQVAQQWDGEILPRLSPLDDRLTAEKVNLEAFIPAVRANSGSWNGKTWALPISCDVITLLYRTDVFAERAAEFKQQTGRDLRPPSTWPEYLELARFFNTDSIHGNIIMGLKEQNYTLWSGILLALGGKLVDDNWEPAFATEAGVRSLEIYTEMFRYAPPASQRFGIEEANALFLQGKGVMYLTWPTLIWAQMQDTNICKIPGKVAAATIPGGKPQLSSWSLGINSASNKRDAAFKWICYFTSEKNTRRLLLQYGKGSPLTSTYQDQECLTRVFYLPEILKGMADCEPRPRIPPSQELCDYLDYQLAEAVAGRITPRVALDRAAAQWRVILRESGYARP